MPTPKKIHRYRHNYYPKVLPPPRVGVAMAKALSDEATRLHIGITDIVRDALEKRMGVPAADPKPEIPLRNSLRTEGT